MAYKNMPMRRARNLATLLLTGLLAWPGVGVGNALAAASVASQSASYVVNLESSRRGIDPRVEAAAKRLPGQTYILEVNVKGVKWERLRLGFFASELEAKKAMTRMLDTFPQAWITRIDAGEIRIGQCSATWSAAKPAPVTKPAPVAKAPPAKVTPDEYPFVVKTQPPVVQKPATGQAAQKAPGRYIINLESSTGHIDSKALEAARATEGHSVYLMRATIKGTEWERLRLGFFSSESEARKVMSGMLARFPQAWVTQGGAEDWELAASQQSGHGTPAESTRVAKVEVLPLTEKAVTAVPEVAAAAPETTASSTDKTEAAGAAAVVSVAAAKPVIRQTPSVTVSAPVPVARTEVPTPAKNTPTATPEAVASANASTTVKVATGASTLAVVATAAIVDEVAGVAVNDLVQPADAATPTSASPKASVAAIVAMPATQGTGNPVASENVKVATAASSAPAPAMAPATPGAIPTDSASAVPRASPVDEQASQRMLEARQAMLDQDWDRAVKLLTSVLGSPDTADHMQAREFLGLARERKGQLAHAKAEYQRYLEDYPDSAGAARVQQRLVGLVTAGEYPRWPGRIPGRGTHPIATGTCSGAFGSTTIVMSARSVTNSAWSMRCTQM